MPYVQKYIPSPTNLSLKVHPTLPDGYSEVKDSIIDTYPLATLGGDWLALPKESLHHCPKCAGWVEGRPNQFKIDNLDGRHLSGRRGVEFFCARCGHKIGFNGIIS